MTAMRVATIAAGLAVMLAACGGEKKAADAEGSATNPAPAAGATPAPAAPAGGTAPAAAGTGATVHVDMVLEGTAYKYVPSEIKAKSGDVLHFMNSSGGPHNVAFKPGKIPSGAEGPIDAALGENKMGPLTGSLIVEQGKDFTLATGGFPKGEYAFACTPHEALGMTGKLTIE